MYRRDLASNGRVAHSSLRNRVEAENFTDGTPHTVLVATTPILSFPRRRERELIFGDTFTVLEQTDGYCFGLSGRDGYVGYVAARDLAPQGEPATHVVRSRLTYALGEPKLKSADDPWFLSFGSRVSVGTVHGDWCEIAVQRRPGDAKSGPYAMYVPKQHLAPIDQHMADPADVAALFLGAPYVWAGNSAFGLDCSGLAQASLLACGIPCPGDSDQQRDAFPAVPGERAGLQRNDLIFWNGHVALALDNTRMIHATAWSMTVLVEDIDAAIARIIAQGEGEPVGFGRPVRQPA